MRYIYSFLFIFVILFSGCSTKKVDVANDSTISVSEEEFLDEFNDEMKVKEKIDPLNGYNRIMTSFNDDVYTYVLSPVAKGYKKVVNKELRVGVNNFFHNIMYPIRFVNNILQGKFSNAVDETGRFLINSTVGFLGMSDQAKDAFNLNPHNEDFGQTLGVWGVGTGPHIVLPFFGPSNLRDTISMYPNSLLNPVDYYENRGFNLTDSSSESLGLKALQIVNNTSLTCGQYKKLKEDAIDLYPYLRDVYEQRRIQEIKE